MIHSMTGFGSAQVLSEGVAYSAELRSVNGRYLKLVTKLPEHLQFAEAVVERVLRSGATRGSVTFTLRVRREGAYGTLGVNVAALEEYLRQVARVSVPTELRASIDLAGLAQLPGVCDAPEIDDDQRASIEATVEILTRTCLDEMMRMRRDEGEALAGEFGGLCRSIEEQLNRIEARAPVVVQEYHDRLRNRVEALMAQSGIELAADGLMREVAVYAERSDITEEVTRLRVHTGQFVALCREGSAVGRKLDFLAQEMLREANTISSKSSDVAIAQAVVDVKCLIDRLKEQVQNVE